MSVAEELTAAHARLPGETPVVVQGRPKPSSDGTGPASGRPARRHRRLSAHAPADAGRRDRRPAPPLTVTCTAESSTGASPPNGTSPPTVLLEAFVPVTAYAAGTRSLHGRRHASRPAAGPRDQPGVGGRPGPARRAPGRRAEHRPRGGRPPRRSPATATDVALRLLDRRGDRRDVTYGELAEADQPLRQRPRPSSAVGPGDSGSSCSPAGSSTCTSPCWARSRPAAWPARCSPRSAPSPSASDSTWATRRLLVTTPELYRRRIAPATRPAPRPRATCSSPGRTAPASGALALEPAARPTPPPTYRIRATSPEDPALLHFTSGTTGAPKGALHVHEAVVAHHATGRHLLGLGAGRRVLVHRGPRLGHRHELRHHRPAHLRSHQPRRRGRLRRAALVPDPRRGARGRLVHRAHRHPHAHAGRGRPRRRDRPRRSCASPPAWASRCTPTPSAGLAECSATIVHGTPGGRPRPAAS